MSASSTAGVVKVILSKDLSLTADEVIAKAKAGGLKATPESIRAAVYNVRSELNKAAKATPAKPAQSSTASPVKPTKPATAPAASRQTPAPKAAAAAAPDLSAVFSNVALVNAVVGACGGVDQARQAAEAVRACGGVDAFLQHLDLVAGIRTA